MNSGTTDTANYSYVLADATASYVIYGDYTTVLCITSGTLKICPNLQVSALSIYITMSICFDYGIFT